MLSTSDMLPPMKRCARCGAAFSPETWRALAYVGVQEDGEGGALSLRNCGCGSTLAIDLADEVSS